MSLFVAGLLLLFGVSTDARSKRDVWKEIREVLPEEYARVAETRGLNASRLFHNTVIQLTYEQVLQETEALAARRHILQEYVDCSCPKCPSYQEEFKNRSKREVDFDPMKVVGNMLVPCDSEMVLKSIKLLRLGLSTTQLSYQQLVTRIACNCPSADTCRGILDPLVFSIISGQNDTEVSKAYWQGSLRGFPQLLERALMETISGAASSILSYFYQALRPKPTTAIKPTTTKPTTTTPPSQETEVPPSALPAPPAPAGIFAPGQDPTAWQNGNFPGGCSQVHVNITNMRTVTTTKEDNFTMEIENTTSSI